MRLDLTSKQNIIIPIEINSIDLSEEVYFLVLSAVFVEIVDIQVINVFRTYQILTIFTELSVVTCIMIAI